MIHGETVTIEHKVEAVEDAMGDMVYGEPTYEDVDNVLIQVGSTDNLSGNIRPDGVMVRYTLHFPKTYNHDMTGKRVKVRGEWHEVVGSPAFYDPRNTPTDWNYPVEVKRVDG